MNTSRSLVDANLIASFCHCAYVLRISGYSGFLRNLPTKGPVIIYRLGGGAEDLGGIIWLSEGLRGGSAVIDRRKGGIRPKKKGILSGGGTQGRSL